MLGVRTTQREGKPVVLSHNNAKVHIIKFLMCLNMKLHY